MRSGRLDRKIEFPHPTEDARAKILQIHSRKMNVAPDVNFEELARSTDDFNAAQLKAVRLFPYTWTLDLNILYILDLCLKKGLHSISEPGPLHCVLNNSFLLKYYERLCFTTFSGVKHSEAKSVYDNLQFGWYHPSIQFSCNMTWQISKWTVRHEEPIKDSCQCAHVIVYHWIPCLV